MPVVVPSQVANLIDLAFPWAAKQSPTETMPIYPDHIGVLYAISEMSKAIPSDLMILSPADGTKFNAALWTIRARLESWHAHGLNGTMDRVTGIDRRNPVSVMREYLAKCPDEPVPVDAKEFAFVDDNELRQSILSDLGAVSRALSNAEWKAATVIAGSCLEALLLWAAKRVQGANAANFNVSVAKTVARALKQQPPGDLDQWSLFQLIECCLDMGVISENTATQARLTKNFRNLIHPGRAVRLSEQCNIGTAMAARAALEFAAIDLAKRF
jgi:hypothetical protein